MTEPVLCVLDDDLTYCVKGRGALAKGKIAEVISGVVGREIGLPIPDFSIANLSAAMIFQSGDEPNIRRIGAQPAFASLWKEPVDNFLIVMRTDFPARLLASVYVFDHWVRNGDRTLTEHGGNVNLLVNLGAKEKELVVIDHNLAFSPSYSVDDLSTHVGYPSWRNLDGRLQFSENLKASMLRARDKVQNISDSLPDEWLEEEPDFVDHALEALERVDGSEFWDELS
ncbi:hypothetical protein CA833_09920 [Novosphingobium sp. KA1]|nr:hypothetical protein CA833_09920 [Novosphingobium sp. KA1]